MKLRKQKIVNHTSYIINSINLLVYKIARTANHTLPTLFKPEQSKSFR